jgi:chondroitin-sulfate-ABC endolyase/exolyase
MMKDGPEKAGAMKGLVRYFNHVCAIAPGYSDTIKPDYTLYHHRSAYQSAYGVSMVTTMTMIDWLLKGTPYELSAESRTILKNTLDAQLKMANLYALHPGVGGRFPLNNALDMHMLPAYAFAALTGMEVSDPDMAAKFNRLYKPELNKPGFPGLTYNGTLGTMELMKKVSQAAGGRKLGPPAGHFNFPYAAMDVHRRDNWMAAVRGWSQYVWDFESGSQHENDMGRYLSHGALFLFTDGDPISLKGSASDMEKGYHWAFLPGATTKALPMKDVVFKYEAVPKYLECKHRNYSDETFVGGVTLGGNGFFSMKLHDTVAPDEDKTIFDDSFRAVKSYFFVDNEIYCLGSGVECKDSRYSTVTTVFQNTLNGETVPFALKPGEETGLDGGVLRDIPGNAYFITKGQNVRVLQSVQESFKRSKGGLLASDGPNYRAWIDHGKAPTAGSYEYLVAVKPDAAQVKKLTDKVPFTVLQKNKDAHVIQCPEKGLTAYAVFEPAKALPNGLINSVDTPLLVMTEAQKNSVKLAVADPDLRLKKWGHNMSFMPSEIVNPEAQAHTATITLNGKWKLAAPVEGVKIHSAGWFGGKTIVETVLQHGLTKECALICD